MSPDRLAAAEARGFAFIEFQDAQTALRAFTLRHRATIQHHGAPKRLLLVCIYSCPFNLFYVISAYTFGQYFFLMSNSAHTRSSTRFLFGDVSEIYHYPIYPPPSPYMAPSYIRVLGKGGKCGPFETIVIFSKEFLHPSL